MTFQDLVSIIKKANTRIVKTPHGFHVYFSKSTNMGIIRNAQDILQTKKTENRAVDVRGENGYVVLPPSENYVWANNNEIKELPNELLSKINCQVTAKSSQPRSVTPDVGNRHDWFMREAGSLFGKGFTLDRATLHLCAINDTMEDPLSNDDLVALIERIHNAEKKSIGQNENIFEPGSHIDKYKQFLKSRGTQTAPEFSTGFDKLDKAIWGYNRGELHIVCGKPNAGKSLFMVIGTLVNAKLGKRALIFSTETSANKLVNRVMSHEYGIDSGHLRRSQLTRQEIDILRETALPNFSQLPLIICDNKSLGMPEIKKTIKKYSPDIVFVDYFQRCKFSNDSHFVKEAFAKSLKDIAVDFNIPVVVGTQVTPRKIWVKNKSGEGKMIDADITSGDVRSTQALWHEADISLIINDKKNLDTNQTVIKLSVDKARDADYVTLYLKFDKQLLRYYPITREEYYSII